LHSTWQAMKLLFCYCSKFKSPVHTPSSLADKLDWIVSWKSKLCYYLSSVRVLTTRYL
jgi:hypothetical protein